MNSVRLCPAILGLAVLFTAACGSPNPPSSPVSPACVPSTKPEFSYVLTGFSVAMYTVNSCTGQFDAAKPASIATGYALPQQGAEQMVADPLGRFAYVANLVSNASDKSTISMFTINSDTGVLTPTKPATVATGFFPQTIAIDPRGRFVYTANSDDSSVSMFTIDQTTGVLTATQPSSVSTLVTGEPLSDPSFLTVDPTGRFLYVTVQLSDGAAVFMYNINQTTGVLTPTSPAMVYTGGIPFQVVVAPNGKFAYVVNNLTGSGGLNGVWGYTVNSTTGVLTPTGQIAFPSGNGPTAVVVDPTSKYAYVVNRADNTVSMFTIDQVTGNLTPNATATNPTGTIATGSQPFRIDFDPSGKFLYVTNEQSGVSIYTVNSDGTLANAGTTGVIAGGLSTAITAMHE